jgi:hypothetical protein
MFSALRVCIRALRRSPNTYAVIVGLILVIFPPLWFSAIHVSSSITFDWTRRGYISPSPSALRLLHTAENLSNPTLTAPLIFLAIVIGVALIVLGLSRALKATE